MKFGKYRPSIKTKSLTKRKPVCFDSGGVSDSFAAKEKDSNDDILIQPGSKVENLAWFWLKTEKHEE